LYKEINNYTAYSIIHNNWNFMCHRYLKNTDLNLKAKLKEEHKPIFTYLDLKKLVQISYYTR